MCCMHFFFDALMYTHGMQSWIEEVSTFLKQQDPNHLVTVGEEGFYGMMPWRTAAQLAMCCKALYAGRLFIERVMLPCFMLPHCCYHHIDSLHPCLADGALLLQARPTWQHEHGSMVCTLTCKHVWHIVWCYVAYLCNVILRTV